jgi:hypothetical protein
LQRAFRVVEAGIRAGLRTPRARGAPDRTWFAALRPPPQTPPPPPRPRSACGAGAWGIALDVLGAQTLQDARELERGLGSDLGADAAYFADTTRGLGRSGSRRGRRGTGPGRSGSHAGGRRSVRSRCACDGGRCGTGHGVGLSDTRGCGTRPSWCPSGLHPELYEAGDGASDPNRCGSGLGRCGTGMGGSGSGPGRSGTGVGRSGSGMDSNRTGRGFMACHGDRMPSHGDSTPGPSPQLAQRSAPRARAVVAARACRGGGMTARWRERGRAPSRAGRATAVGRARDAGSAPRGTRSFAVPCAQRDARSLERVTRLAAVGRAIRVARSCGLRSMALPFAPLGAAVAVAQPCPPRG